MRFITKAYASTYLFNPQLHNQGNIIKDDDDTDDSIPGNIEITGVYRNQNDTINTVYTQDITGVPPNPQNTHNKNN